ncbi:ParB N-terminal domain-containing protein [Candidatus Micrarchaeota archaeon]|nr:ParB N-terminal domain-containing protein [Candidatus Micrarchaeota archaeon]
MENKKEKNGYEVMSIEILRPHEEVDPENYEKLLKEISDNRYVVPIIVDSAHNVILDGHHRFNVLRALGYSRIPAIKVNYNSEEVKVASWREEMLVSKEDVIRRGLSGNLYPPKTSRHLLNKPNNRIPLHSLGEVNK